MEGPDLCRVWEKINGLAAALIHAGEGKEDNVGIYSANRYEWAVTDYAYILAGAVSVPITAPIPGNRVLLSTKG